MMSHEHGGFHSGISLAFFFFSSRRRHTIFDCDWSSDVCSSDLAASRISTCRSRNASASAGTPSGARVRPSATRARSEEHTSELQSQSNLVCRLLLEKKKTLPRDVLHATKRRAAPISVQITHTAK